ncbi:hypothetical protein L9F63_028268, partial [Diploptera punctata]
MTEHISQQILYTRHPEPESHFRLENPMVATLIRQSKQTEQLLDVKKLFLSDMTLLCNNNRENRRTVLQMSVWQEWLIAMAYIHPKNSEEQKISDMVYSLFRMLLHHAIKHEYGGWRVWVDTLAIVHSKVSYEEFKLQFAQMYEHYERQRSDNITDPAVRQQRPISTISGWDQQHTNGYHTRPPITSWPGSALPLQDSQPTSTAGSAVCSCDLGDQEAGAPLQEPRQQVVDTVACSCDLGSSTCNLYSEFDDERTDSLPASEDQIVPESDQSHIYTVTPVHEENKQVLTTNLSEERESKSDTDLEEDKVESVTLETRDVKEDKDEQSAETDNNFQKESHSDAVESVKEQESTDCESPVQGKESNDNVLISEKENSDTSDTNKETEHSSETRPESSTPDTNNPAEMDDNLVESFDEAVELQDELKKDVEPLDLVSQEVTVQVEHTAEISTERKESEIEESEDGKLLNLDKSGEVLESSNENSLEDKKSNEEAVLILASESEDSCSNSVQITGSESDSKVDADDKSETVVELPEKDKIGAGDNVGEDKEKMGEQEEAGQVTEDSETASALDEGVESTVGSCESNDNLADVGVAKVSDSALETQMDNQSKSELDNTNCSQVPNVINNAVSCDSNRTEDTLHEVAQSSVEEETRKEVEGEPVDPVHFESKRSKPCQVAQSSSRPMFSPGPTRPPFRIPEFKWSYIHQRLLSDVLFSLETDIQVWRSHSTKSVLDFVNSSENAIFVVNTVHLISQLADNLIIACGGLLPLLASATSPNNELDVIEPTQGMPIEVAVSFLQRLVNMADVLIFASSLNFGELEAEKKHVKWWYTASVSQIGKYNVCTCAVRNCLECKERSRPFPTLSPPALSSSSATSNKAAHLQSLIRGVQASPKNIVENLASQSSPVKDPEKLLQDMDVNRLRAVIYRDVEETKQAQFLSLAIVYFISVLMVSKYRDILEPPLTPRPPSPTAPTATAALRSNGASHHGGSTGSPPETEFLLTNSYEDLLRVSAAEHKGNINRKEE